jgi:glycosyltransferase involved in cell wall biosynthesis
MPSDSARSLLLVGPPARQGSGVGTFQQRLAEELAERAQVERLDVRAGMPFGAFDRVDRHLIEQCEAALFACWVPFTLPLYARLVRRLRARGTRCVALVHSYAPRHAPQVLRAAMRQHLRLFDAHLALTGSDPALVPPTARWAEHPPSDRFGPLVSRAEACHRLGLDPSRRWLLHFGFGRPYKGLSIAIEAMRHLDASAALLVVGDQSGRAAEVHALFDQVDANRIHLVDQSIPDADVPLYFAAADLALLPYLQPISSGVASLAVHYGLPIVATDFPGLREAAAHHPASQLVAPNDSIALGIAIRNGLGHPDSTRPRSTAATSAAGWTPLANRLLGLLLADSNP